METALWIKSIFKALILPPSGLVLLALAGVSLDKRCRRTGRALTVAALLVLLALSLPVVAGLLMQALHAPAPFTSDAAGDAGAIVVFGGGRRAAPEYGGETMNALTLERVRYAAHVARMTGLPLLLSGGALGRGTSEAVIMGRALTEEFGVRVNWLEARSRNTHENARFSAAILRDAGIHKVVLVMHGFDMRRAAAELEAAGIDVVPAATNLPGSGAPEMFDWLPNISALVLSYYSIYEILGNLNRSIFTDTDRAMAGT